VTVSHGIAWSRGAHLTADGRLVDPLSVGMNLSMDRWLVKRQRFFPTIRRVPGTVISLSTDGHNNYYHWMLDLLPKLFIALAAGLNQGTFYLGASARFQQETLELLGIASARVLDCNAMPFLQADEMVVPFLGERHPPNVFNAGKCRLLADVFSFLVASKTSSRSLPVRFVVSRSKTRSRRVVNEAELLARLEPLGFRSVHLEDLSLVEQITLFARAEAIVASTGAGLVNLIHARPGIPVAILMPEECPDLVCRDIAAFAGLHCEVFYAQRHPPDTSDKIGCDITLDPPLLTKLVRHVTA
jgi:capsular polysaccharide biosynthesis protein